MNHEPADLTLTHPPAPDAAAPAAPASAAAAAPALDGAGAAKVVGDAGLAAAIDRASDVARDLSAAERPAKRQRGQRGPDVKPRAPRGSKSVGAVAELAPAMGQVSFEGAAPEPVLPPVPSFDEEMAEAVVENTLGLLNDGAAMLVESYGLRQHGDKGAAAAAGESVRMTPKAQKAIHDGSILLLKQNAVDLKNAPWVMLLTGFGVWGAQIAGACRAQRALAESARRPVTGGQ